jgi:energy-converting hydrogenase Eha subunit F
MNMHLLAGVAVLLILVAISAYREALKNEPISRFRMNQGSKLPPMDENE